MNTVQYKFDKSWTTVAACRPYRYGKHISRVQGRAKKIVRKIKAGDLAGAIKISMNLAFFLTGISKNL